MIERCNSSIKYLLVSPWWQFLDWFELENQDLVKEKIISLIGKLISWL